MSHTSITVFFADIFKVNLLLSFLELELTCEEGAPKKHKSDGHETDYKGSTVYKHMKEYPQDGDDYFPSDSSEDSMAYETTEASRGQT